MLYAAAITAGPALLKVRLPPGSGGLRCLTSEGNRHTPAGPCRRALAWGGPLLRRGHHSRQHRHHRPIPSRPSRLRLDRNRRRSARSGLRIPADMGIRCRPAGWLFHNQAAHNLIGRMRADCSSIGRMATARISAPDIERALGLMSQRSGQRWPAYSRAPVSRPLSPIGSGRIRSTNCPFCSYDIDPNQLNGLLR